MDEENFLLTGDVGIRGLNNAISYSNKIGIDLKEVDLYQIPHHGGRHNINTCVLNNLIGPIVNENHTPSKIALVSVAKGSSHPRKMVTNAFIRRGVNVVEARAQTLRHSANMPQREGWSVAPSITFSPNVEDWH
jgi:beta-lactamase superfamily II metal-dependent hydrolase